MLGLAVISGPDLLAYHIKLRKEVWTLHKRETILTSLHPWCERYSISNVALSIPYEKQISSQTQELLESITLHFKQKGIPVSSYTPPMVSAFYRNAKTKKEIMKTIADRHMDLMYHYTKEMRNKHKYYIKLFDAVAVATIHYERMKHKV